MILLFAVVAGFGSLFFLTVYFIRKSERALNE